jgi:hypothetical protein
LLTIEHREPLFLRDVEMVVGESHNPDMDASRRIFLAAVTAWWPVRRVPANHQVIFLPGKSCRVPALAEWRAAEARMPEIARKLDELEVRPTTLRA